MNTLANLLWLENILIDLDVSSKSQLFEVIGRYLEQRCAMPQRSVAESLSRRVLLGSTAMGDGVAFSHACVTNLERIQIVYARLKSLIPFDAPDGKPVSDILVLLVPRQATEEHFRILAEATKMFSDRRFRELLLLCKNTLEVKGLFMTWSLAY